MMRQPPSHTPVGVGTTAAGHWYTFAQSLSLLGLAAVLALGQAEERKPSSPGTSPMARAPETVGQSHATGTPSTAAEYSDWQASPKSDDARAATGDSVEEDLRARAMTPSMAFEQAPGVLGISNRSKRLEGVRAYATEPLGLTALGLEDVGLPPVNKKDRIEVNLGERVRFDDKGDRIPPTAHRLLDGIGRVLAENVETDIEIRVHTDDQGDAGFNRALSQRRADAIRAYLIGRGVGEERISGVGMGESAPLAFKKGRSPTRSERIKNRRVELVIAPREIPETETAAASGLETAQSRQVESGTDTVAEPSADPSVKPEQGDTLRR